MRRVPLTVAALLGASCALAQDLSIQGGALQVNRTHEHTFAAALSYTQPVDDYLALSLSYLNEGHPRNHHRDGVAAQGWLRTHVYQSGLSFGMGAGLDYYFDTSRPPAALGDGYTNDHGWAPIYSLRLSWHDPSRWYGQVQLNRIFPSSSHDKSPTTALMAGVGYRFDDVRGDQLHLEGLSKNDSVTLLAGQTIVNSFASERSQAASIEYRRPVGHYLDWTVTALNEGTSSGARRNGVATQMWLIRSLDTDTELGMAIGPYAVFQVHEVPGRLSHAAGLVSIAGRYHFGKRMVAELEWHRVLTGYHRDADMLLAGLGFSF